MRAFVIALLCCGAGCATSPELGDATWTETPVGESALFKLSYVTRSGEIAVRFVDNNASLTCSELSVATIPAAGESRISFSAQAIHHNGMVSVVSPLDPTTSSATVVFSTRIYSSGTVTLSQTDARLVGTFRAAGATSDGTPAAIEGSFDAPFCD
ncbi:MAG: hypothetical protein ABI591_18155 [Kofleriaceae bacterium]